MDRAASTPPPNTPREKERDIQSPSHTNNNQPTLPNQRHPQKQIKKQVSTSIDKVTVEEERVGGTGEPVDGKDVAQIIVLAVNISTHLYARADIHTHTT